MKKNNMFPKAINSLFLVALIICLMFLGANLMFSELPRDVDKFSNLAIRIIGVIFTVIAILIVIKWKEIMDKLVL